MTPALLIFCPWIIAALIIGWLAYRAPEGFEIEGDGFRYGPVPPAALDEGDFDAEGNDLKLLYDAGAGNADRHLFAPVFLSLHATGDTYD